MQFEWDQATRRVVDLSLPISSEMAGANVSVAKTIAKEGWNARTLTLYSHCGTHVDAPCHFLPGGDTLDQQDLAVCVGPALVVNLAPVALQHLITVEHLTDYAARIGAGARLLLRTDWHKRFGTPEYRNALPRISLELAEWMVERRVAMVGVEGPSVADVNNMRELTDVHQTLFRGRVLIIEGLANLDQLNQDEVWFVGLPLKVSGGDGSPIRAIAIETATEVAQRQSSGRVLSHE